jgi:hypothetical protein
LLKLTLNTNQSASIDFMQDHDHILWSSVKQTVGSKIEFNIHV